MTDRPLAHPLVLELFPCSGGMAEGARRAGVEVSMSFDWSADACASYAANLGHRPIRVDVDDLVRMTRAGWRPGPIDLLIADPPCTPWSRAGKRLGTADERDMLEATVELVTLLRPRAYLIANVPGLDDGPNWPVVQRTIGGLAAHGYCVVDFARLDAADYGVPQHRVRPFWFGHLDGSCIAWPARTHGAPDETAPTLPGVARLRPYVTCRDALSHLSPEELGRPIKLRWRGCSSMQGACVVAPWPWDRPSTTVTTRDVVPPPGHHPETGSVLSQPGAIKLSEKAAAILQGFPDGWTFVGRTKEARWDQIGMAMPPGLAEPVFRAICVARGWEVRRAA